MSKYFFVRTVRIWCAFFALGIVSGAASAQTATTKLYGRWDLVGFRKTVDISKPEIFVSGAIHSIMTWEFAAMSFAPDGAFAIFQEGQLVASRKGTWKVLSEQGFEGVEIRLNWRSKTDHIRVQFDKDGSILVSGLVGAATPVFRRAGDSDVAPPNQKD